MVSVVKYVEVHPILTQHLHFTLNRCCLDDIDKWKMAVPRSTVDEVRLIGDGAGSHPFALDNISWTSPDAAVIRFDGIITFLSLDAARGAGSSNGDSLRLEGYLNGVLVDSMTAALTAINTWTPFEPMGERQARLDCLAPGVVSIPSVSTTSIGSGVSDTMSRSLSPPLQPFSVLALKYTDARKTDSTLPT